jgi:hypothetical protein
MPVKKAVGAAKRTLLAKLMKAATTPSTKSTAPAAAEDSVASLTSGIKKLTVSSFTPFSMSIAWPYMVKQYTKNSRWVCSVEFLTFAMDIDMFQEAVMNNGTTLELTTTVPSWFPEEDRLLAANTDINENTNEATAHQDVVQLIRKMYAGKKEYTGTPQIVKLPFACEQEAEDKSAELYHGNEEISTQSGHQQYLQVVKFELISTEKKLKKKKVGTMRIIGSPLRPGAAANNGVAANNAAANNEDDNDAAMLNGAL